MVAYIVFYLKNMNNRMIAANSLEQLQVSEISNTKKKI